MPVSRDDVLVLALLAWIQVRGVQFLIASDVPWLWGTWLMVAAMLLSLSPSVQRALRADGRRGGQLALAAPVIFVAIGIVAAVAAGAVNAARTAGFAATLVPLVLVLRRPAGREGAWLLLLAAALVLPAAVWDRALRLDLPGQLRVGYALAGSTALGVLALTVVRPLGGMNLRPWLSAGALRATGLGVAALLLVTMPLGWALGFVVWAPREWTAAFHAERFLALVVLVALPEELLFRGLIQEGLARLRGERFALVVAAGLFGLIHITKPTGLLPGQINDLGLNWRLALLAALAGLAYGWVYMRTRALAAAVLAHGTVNWLWGSFFIR
jgi:membrane protease YdiL (CAAX protease family)